MPKATDACFSIVGRRRPDPMSLSRCEDFRLRVSRDIAPADWFAERDWSWTPYCYRAATDQIALVGCPANVDLASAPFYYQAQYKHAERLVLLSRAEFVALPPFASARKPLPVMIYSTGRAGTTLVSKMFGKLSRCVSLSEPDLPSSLLEVGPTDPVELAPLLSQGSQLYFQPASSEATHLVQKFRGMCIELAPAYRIGMPEAVEVFLYRDAETYVTSSMRAFGYFRSPLWWSNLLYAGYVTRPILTQLIAASYEVLVRFFPLVRHYTPRDLCRLGPVGVLALGWLSMMERALDLHKTQPLPALRYEELMRNPREQLSRLLTRCQLPLEHSEQALAALDDDSQRGSVVARKNTNRFELSQRDRQTIRSVLASHPVINKSDFEFPA